MALTCPQCGSARIVPNVPLVDRFGDYGGLSDSAQVKVHGNPQAWVFKDTVVGTVTADVCGECGHAQLRVGNFRELYEKYRQTHGDSDDAG